MKTYKKTNGIDSFCGIPWDKPIVISGSIGRDAWMWKMPGVFERNNGKARFVDEYGMAEYLDENTHISLNVFEVEG